jgi:hypothetical protein
MSKTLKNNDKYKKIRVERKNSRSKELRVQKVLEMQEQEILERYNIRNSNYIR